MSFLLLLTLLMPAQTFVQVVDTAVKNGFTDEAGKWEILETAVKNPEDLPAYWKDILRDHPIPPSMGTSILHDAFLYRTKHMKAAPGENFEDYQFPNELQYILDSENYPIRVEYDNPSDEALAREVLDAAERSWELEIGQWGWWAPPIVTPEGRFRLYVAQTGMGGGGYTAPRGYYSETAWTDCVTYVVIDNQNPVSYAGIVVAHEMNHTMQAAMDCMEPSSFWENTATFVMAEVYPDQHAYRDSFLGYFQDNPYMGVDEGNQQNLYWYGGFLWPYFLAYTYRQADEPPAVFMRKVWEHASQNGMFNDPDYLHALDTLLKERGSSLVEAFHAFTRARYFVGSNSSELWTVLPGVQNFDPSPYLSARLYYYGDDYSSESTTAPHVFGVNYIKLNATGDDTDRSYTVKLKPKGDEGDEWHVQVVGTLSGYLYEADTTAASPVSLLLKNGVEPSIIMVERYRWPDHTAGEASSGADYEISIEPTVPLPVISWVAPNALKRGGTYDISVYGFHFQDGATVTFMPDDMTVNSVTVLSDSQISLSLTVPMDAAEGSYDVTVENPDGGTYTLQKVVKVEGQVEKKDDASGSDDGCNTSGARPSMILSILLALGLAMSSVRRSSLRN